ncbi:hypothetical protein PsYK624_007280 [Phanerochaete sordida]|uniref:Uncharacterized protein n=1 Tax=Phanerochaete sordida TaxID=48140 RepID=A0A9P3FX08_9APHY|nr:hypothetical protein PsYK624_007280 [Phanerochaete sordida]
MRTALAKNFPPRQRPRSAQRDEARGPLRQAIFPPEFTQPPTTSEARSFLFDRPFLPPPLPLDARRAASGARPSPSLRAARSASRGTTP